MSRVKTTWAIFQSRNGNRERNDGWLDYAREEVPSGTDPQTWADEQSAALAKRIGCECRAKIEIW